MLSSLAVPASASGYAPCTPFTGYINGYRINVRTGPGTSNAVCGVAMCGTPFCVTSQAYCSGGRLWYYGTLGSLAGWVYSGYVCGAPVEAMAAVTSCPVTCNVGYILLDASNFRSGPGTGYSVIMQLACGTVLQITGAVRDVYGSVWYQAQVSGLTGWVRSDLVSTSAAGCTGVSGNCVSSWGGIYASGFNGCTNTRAVNVRLAPNGTKIAQVPCGTPVNVTGMVCVYGVYWYQVYFYGTTAYIRADLVNTVYPAAGAYTLCPQAGMAVGGSASVISGSAPVTVFGSAAECETGGYLYDGSTMYNTPAAGSPETVQAPVASGHAVLSFTTFSLTPGQTLPVYTAPSASSPRADSGTAVMTVSGQVWAAGYDGQWLLVMYQNDSGMSRVGYVNAFQLQGVLPEVQNLDFTAVSATVTARTALTSDPLEGTDTLMMLDSGSAVTWLADLDMNGAWAYVEVYVNGTAVRGFVPQAVLK